MLLVAAAACRRWPRAEAAAQPVAAALLPAAQQLPRSNAPARHHAGDSPLVSLAVGAMTEGLRLAGVG